MTLGCGQILDGTYRLLRPVAEGGMGVVYEATHARLAGRYAIKVLTPRLAESPEGLAQFNREARITSLLQHPNVVQVIDHNTAPDGTEYLVMEYLAGDSLSQRLAREGRLPLDTVVDIIDQIAAGLSAAHAHGIVHRDLKPDNVVLVPVEGRPTELVKILDFGVSKRHGSLEASGLVCGTPQYMAPEQVEGRILEINASTDQFALAVIAQELLTGENPFAGDTVASTFARVASAPPTTVGLGEGVDAVLARALAKSGPRRFRSVADFSQAFRAAALARGRADQPVATVPARRTLRRRNWTMGLGAAAIVIGMSLVVESSPNRHSSRPQNQPAPQAEPAPPAEPSVVQQIAEPEVTVLTTTAQPSRRTDGDEPSGARTRLQPARVRPTSPVTTSRPRSALSVDEDATMPLTETSGNDPTSR